MAQLKTAEAIEQLLNSNPEKESFLFNLSELHKIDLEKFINNNFMFNIPISEFARLTGRSLSTFKRGFQKNLQRYARKLAERKTTGRSQISDKRKRTKTVRSLLQGGI
jgi:AraC-like DNA-binding protein